MRTYERQLAPNNGGAIRFNAYGDGSTPSATTTFDTASYEQIAVVPVMASLLTSGATVSILLTHSDSPSTGFTQVSGFELSLDDSVDVQALGFVRRAAVKRYLRLTSTVSGAAASFGCILFGLGPRNLEDQVAVGQSL